MSAITDMTAMLMKQAEQLMSLDNPDAIAVEVSRGNQLTKTADSLLDFARLQLDAIELMDNVHDETAHYAASKMLGNGK